MRDARASPSTWEGVGPRYVGPGPILRVVVCFDIVILHSYQATWVNVTKPGASGMEDEYLVEGAQRMVQFRLRDLIRDVQLGQQTR